MSTNKQTENSVLQDRIIWIDIFKAICITCMVIGHATSLLTPYIYQFHMGVFLLISGYTTNLNKRSFIRTVIDRSYTLIVPYVFMFFLFTGITALLNAADIYTMFFETPYVNTSFKIIDFFQNSNIHINLLGATWFLPALFFSNIIQSFLYKISGNRINVVYLISTALLFLFGYYIVATPYLKDFMLDTAFIAQGYFAIGILCKRYDLLRYISNKVGILISGLIGVVSLVFFAGTPSTVDYPSRSFGNPLINLLAVLGGFLFCYFLAKIIEALPHSISKQFVFVGKNTIGVLFLHFVFFKLVTLMLIPFGIAEMDDLASFLPPESFGNAWWFLYTIVSVILSAVAWFWLCKVKGLRILLGASPKASKAIAEKLLSFKPIQWLDNFLFVGLMKKLGVIATFIKDNKLFFIPAGILSVAIFLPYITTGIILNDEVLMHLERLHGFFEFFLARINAELSQGRYTRLLAAFNIVLGFPFANLTANRIIQVFILLTTISTFGVFLYKLFKNKYFVFFTTLIILVFLPFTFEHSAPNAFVGLVCFPFLYLLLSFICYINYLECEKSKLLVTSLIFFVMALFSYENAITFVLLYPLLYLYCKKENPFNKKNFIKTNLYFVCCAVGNLMLLFLSQAINAGGGYEGSTIGFVSLASSFEILKVLFLSAFPGYFLFNSKYQYLSETNMMMHDISVLNLRIIVITVALLFVIWFLMKKFTPSQSKTFSLVAVPLVGFAYGFIPATPLAISELYQGNITANFFTNLPVSLWIYMFICFSICWIIWYILLNKNVKLGYLSIAFMIPLIFSVQTMNNIVLQEQQANFKRYETIIEMLDTTAMDKLEGAVIGTESFYETHNLLAIHDGFWTQYANLQGMNITFESINENTDAGLADIHAEILHDDVIVIRSENQAVLLSKKPLPYHYGVPISANNWIQLENTPYTIDEDFYLYHFIHSEEGWQAAPEGTEISFGGTLFTGIHGDGWVEPMATIRATTGDLGNITLQCHYPNTITGREVISIYVDGALEIEHTITEENFDIELSDMPLDEETEIEVVSNFSHTAAPPDIRDLSFILEEFSIE